MDYYDYKQLYEKVKANSDYRPLVLDYYPLITPDPPTEEQLASRYKYFNNVISAFTKKRKLL
jgi:hypothetical protein